MRSNRPARRWVAALGFFLLSVVVLFGAAHQINAQPKEYERLDGELGRAETYLTHGQFEEAIIILEKLRLRDPQNREVHRLLQRGYKRTKEYAKLLDLLLSNLANSQKYTEDASAIADCQFKLGMIEAAESTLVALLTPPPADHQVYRHVARIYQNNGRHILAVDTYEHAREHFAKPRLFSRELADLYEARREYAKAIKEYFMDLQENPRNLRTVRRKIAAIVQVEEGTAELSAALQNIIAENPDDFYAHRLYAEVLLESGNAAAAWPEYLAADQLSENPTEHVLYFIKRCLEDKSFDLVRMACLTFFERYRGHPSSVDVRFSYARALVGLGKPDSAITILREISALFNQPERVAEISLEIGNVYLDFHNNLDSAEFYFRQARTLGRQHEVAIASSIGLGDCLLRRGDLAGADSAYAECEQLPVQQHQREVVKFKRAEVLFFAQEFDSLIVMLDSLIADHPQGFYVNDAIVMTLRVNENREPFDWSLKKFAGAALEMRQKHLDTARALFWELAADSANGLADDALLELGHLYTQTNQPDSAVFAYGKLIECYPDRFLMPAALTAQGEVYATELGQPDSARVAYRRILTEYPASPYLEEARRKLKNLGEL